MSNTNTDVVKALYAHLAGGDIPAVLESLDPAIEWRECPGVAFVNGDGLFIGRDAVLANVFMQIGTHYDGFNISITDILGDGDRVAMMGYYQGTNKATGKPFKAQVAHFWKVKNNKLTHFFQAVDTVSMAR